MTTNPATAALCAKTGGHTMHHYGALITRCTFCGHTEVTL